MTLLDGPGYPAQLAEQLELTRSNVSNHLSFLRELLDVVLAVDTDCADKSASTT